VYSDEIEDKIDEIIALLQKKYGELRNPRWYAIKLLEMDKEIMEKYPLELAGIVDHSYETEIINQKYDFIEEVIEEVLVNKEKKAEKTDRIDAILTHPVLGLPAFLGIMALVFFFTFTIGDFLKGYLELCIDGVSGWISAALTFLHVGDFLTSLIVDGIVAGVGAILSFLPNIFILFLALAILEDSGYMSRVAYVMDGIMSRIHLSGRAFIPMLLGFGCSVPAVMASRALENPRDRVKTILVTPFMSCSARLPIYVWEKVKDYLQKAGTTIFLASVIVWFVLNFGPAGMVTDIKDSFGAILGKWLVPVLAPAGLGMWQLGVALISGIAAKEVVVSSMTVLFPAGNINSAGGMGKLSGILAQYGFGAVNAYAMMVFSLLYVPCIATLATMRKELNSRKLTLLAILMQLLIAWGMAVLVYQIGSRFF
jgi:ferrous iron transport protein B